MYTWSLKKWISETTVSENVMVDWNCYTLLFVVGFFSFSFFLLFFFSGGGGGFGFFVFFWQVIFLEGAFLFWFWGGLFCFNFLSFTLYCLKVMKFACTSHLFRCEAWHKKIVIWHQDLLSKSFQSLPGIVFLVSNSWMFLPHTSLHF